MIGHHTSIHDFSTHHTIFRKENQKKKRSLNGFSLPEVDQKTILLPSSAITNQII